MFDQSTCNADIIQYVTLHGNATDNFVMPSREIKINCPLARLLSFLSGLFTEDNSYSQNQTAHNQLHDTLPERIPSLRYPNRSPYPAIVLSRIFDCSLTRLQVFQYDVRHLQTVAIDLLHNVALVEEPMVSRTTLLVMVLRPILVTSVVYIVAESLLESLPCDL